MGVRRTALTFERDFTQIPNAWVRDERLSRKARGVLTEIMSHQVGWHVSVRGLEKTGPEGRDAIRAALVELKEAGYLQVSQTRGDGGRFNEVEYELCDPSTADGKPVSGGLSGDGSAARGQSDHKNTISIEDHPEEAPVVPSGDAMDEALSMLWNLWPTPRRGTTKKASSSFRTAVTANGGRKHIEVILEAARRDVAVWRTWAPGDVQFIPLLSTWLNQGRWEPQAAAMPRGTPRTYAQRQQDNTLSLVERYREEESRNAQVGDSGAGRVRGIDRGA